MTNSPGERGHAKGMPQSGDAAVPTAEAEEASDHLGQGDQDDGRKRKSERGKAMPAAGPHADPSLTNPDATPGTGALPEPGATDATDDTSS